MSDTSNEPQHTVVGTPSWEGKTSAFTLSLSPLIFSLPREILKILKCGFRDMVRLPQPSQLASDESSPSRASTVTVASSASVRPDPEHRPCGHGRVSGLPLLPSARAHVCSVQGELRAHSPLPRLPVCAPSSTSTLLTPPAGVPFGALAWLDCPGNRAVASAPLGGPCSPCPLAAGSSQPPSLPTSPVNSSSLQPPRSRP